jgi:uncharacterized protein YdhG (YjbR/CyaY superfamily)
MTQCYWDGATFLEVDEKKRGARETHARLAFLQINLSCTSGITSLVNWSVDWFDYKIKFGEFKDKNVMARGFPEGERMRNARKKSRKAAVRRAVDKGRSVAKGKGNAGRGKEGSAKGAAQTVEQYLARVPGPARGRFQELRAAIRSAVPAEAVEVISYGILALKTKKVLVWYAAFSEHCSLFPTAAVIEEFRDKLVGLTVSKGTVQFPMGKALPTALIKRMVRARVEHS